MAAAAVMQGKQTGHALRADTLSRLPLCCMQSGTGSVGCACCFTEYSSGGKTLGTGRNGRTLIAASAAAGCELLTKRAAAALAASRAAAATAPAAGTLSKHAFKLNGASHSSCLLAWALHMLMTPVVLRLGPVLLQRQCSCQHYIRSGSSTRRPAAVSPDQALASCIQGGLSVSQTSTTPSQDEPPASVPFTRPPGCWSAPPMPSSAVEAAWKVPASWSCRRLRSLSAHAGLQTGHPGLLWVLWQPCSKQELCRKAVGPMGVGMAGVRDSHLAG